MDNVTNNPNLFWIITTALTTLSSIVLGILTWVKSAKLMPKELTKADLENRQVEISLADRYEGLADRAAEKAVNLQNRLNKNEEDITSLKETIKLQSEVISEQSLRLDSQEKEINCLVKELTLAQGEISGLVKDLNLSQAYNRALINQMQNENIVPLEISQIKPEDYMNGDKPKRTYKRKTNKDEENES